MTPNENKMALIEKMYGFLPAEKTAAKYFAFEKLFIQYNNNVNLMSKGDIGVLFEKHVLDSLAITLLKEFKPGIRLLDIGAGGGFPSLVLAIFFNDMEIIALDSIGKKTKFLEEAKKTLELDNFKICRGRAEKTLGLFADIITNRAVGKIPDVWKISAHHLKKNGLFVSYKAKTAREEAKTPLNGLLKPEFVSYSLPLPENPSRQLVIFKKQA